MHKNDSLRELLRRDKRGDAAVCSFVRKREREGLGKKKKSTFVCKYVCVLDMITKEMIAERDVIRKKKKRY